MRRYTVAMVAMAALGAFGCGEPAAPRFVEIRAPGDTRDPIGPYLVTAVVEGADRVELGWRAGEAEGAEPMARFAASWQAAIAGQPVGSRVALWLVAEGPGGEARSGELAFEVRAPDGACLVDGECLPGEICGGGRCRVPPAVCASDDDCGQDLYCAVPGEPCRFRPVRCAEDADCAPGYACVDGACAGRPACLDDTDCPGGRCAGGRCVAEGRCADDGDCGPDEVCDDGACVPGGPMVPCPGGCPAGLRCLASESRCVDCTADGHCPDGHCDLARFVCAPGVRGLPCVPCGPERGCGAGYGCPADTGGACLPTCPAGVCPDGAACERGVCVPLDGQRFCSGAQCALDADCESGVCLAGWCEPRQHCVRDGDCAADRACADSRCVPREPLCDRPGDCAEGRICLGGRCAPGRPTAACAPCTFSSDCESPALCVPFEDGERRCAALCGGGDCPGDALECLGVDRGLLVCLDAQALCPEPVCGRDAHEPNDTAEEARRIALGEVLEGRLCRGDEEWLSFAVAAGTLYLETEGNLELRVLDEAQVERRALGLFAGGNVEVPIDRPGFVVLSTPVDQDFGWIAALGPPQAPACVPDDFEPDGEAGMASVIGSGADLGAVACPDDEDWFRLRARGRGGEVTVAPAGGVLDVRLLSEDGDALDVGRGDGPVVLRVPVGFDAVLIVVRCVDCDAGTPYRLRAALR